MEEKYFDKLTKELSDRLSQSLKDEIKAVKEEQEETIAKLKEQNEVIAERIEKIQNQPAEKVAVAVPGKEDKKVNFYKGYDLKKMGKDLSVQPKFMVADEDREIASKFLIDVVKATNVEGTASRGGYLVPEAYADIVMAHARLNSVALNEAMVMPMSTDTLRIPKEASSVAVTWSAEENSLGESNPTFGEIVLTAQRLGAFGIVSNELLADEQYDFISILTSQFGEAIGQELDDSMFNGGGGSTFTGALSGATTNTVTCAATGTSPNRHIQLTNDELSQAVSKLTDNKLMGAKFYFHQNSMHYVRVQEDTAGNPIFALPGNGVPGTVYEYPYVVSQKVGAAAPGAATPFALFGSLKRCYVIGQRMGGMTLELDPYGLFDTFRTRFRMVTRWDGTVALEDGLVAIKTHA
jgi:HK97 family phage major capsid protein